MTCSLSNNYNTFGSQNCSGLTTVNEMKRIILFVLLIFSIHETFACDICGCSSGNYFIGPFPQFNKHFVGIRYSFRTFNTVLKSDHAQFSKDFYQTTELMGGMKIGKRWQLLTFVPFNINYSATDDGLKQSSGWGDITLLGNYNVFDKIALTKDTESVSQQLWFGGGVKLPTGRFAVDTNELASSANRQPGTGSFDFLVTSTYTLRIKKWGLTSNANYKINQSASNFKFGNRFSATAFIFHSFQIKKIGISPNAGLLYENLSANETHNIQINDTGGNVLLFGTGIEARLKNIAFGFNAQLPAMQNLSGGQTNTKVRGMVHLSYMF
jgi:hypothetical protein